MTTIFITRNLTPYSPFLKCLTAASLNVKGQSLIKFNPIHFGKFPKTDWIFFYSKNAVKYFFDNKPQILSTTQFATIGVATADFLKAYHYTPHFIGTGEPNKTAKLFLSIANNKTVLFPRAQNSRQSIQNILGDQIQAIDLIVYQNTKIEAYDIPICDIIVFTSPMNVEAYFALQTLQKHQKIIAIGQTTANKLIDVGISNYEIASMPSEKGLAKAVLHHI